MEAIGYMTMPAGFRYKDVFLRGKPRHERYDAFSLKHPSMDTEKRAKIFAPFDALKGFNERITDTDVRQLRLDEEAIEHITDEMSA